MRVEEDDGRAQLPAEEDLDVYVEQRKQAQDTIFKTVKENIDNAHEKQKADYSKRASKGVKTFHFVKGDIVLKRNLKNIARKGGKLDAKWLGPYEILDIDPYKRVKLKEINSNLILKARCAWDQLKPQFQSELHTVVNTDIIDLDMDDGTDVDNSEIILNYAPPSPVIRFQNLIGTPKWATSDEIDDFSNLLKRSSNFAGLQSCLLFSDPITHNFVKSVPHDEPFLQILNKGGNHWISLSNCHTSLDVCTVYDPWFELGYTGEQMELLNNQIARLFNTESECIQVRFADVQQQKDGFNCGFYCFAYSVSLVKNEDPRKVNYYPDKLREHAFSCIRDQVISKFPTQSMERKHSGYIAEYQIDIHCDCRMPRRKDMISCNTCFKLFHSECITFSQTGIYLFLFCLFKNFGLIIKFETVKIKVIYNIFL